MSRLPHSTDLYLHEHARYGVIRAANLRRLNVPESTTYRRCQPDGPWTHLLPGIVLLARASPTARQRVEAALLHAEGHGIVTGFEAARRYGLRNVPTGSEIHLLIPAAHQVRSSGFTFVERTVHPPEPRWVDGIPLAPPARAVLDGVRRVRKRDPVLALLIEAIHDGLCSHAGLCAELETGSRRGTALPRALLKLLGEDVRSVPEATAAAIWRKAGLPPAKQNVPLFDLGGARVAVPDLWCDEVGFAWEIDSFEHHYRRSDYRHTLDRNARYTSLGIVFLQTLPSRLKSEPEKVVMELRAAYAAAKKRPRPPVMLQRPA
ncbi:hypothetical protein L3Q67_08395 [Saccharothrix sp. AJ9571]|nr:hypothetical protein L3Q67_08395 [Saccharothrix sp. AJ9571]